MVPRPRKTAILIALPLLTALAAAASVRADQSPPDSAAPARAPRAAEVEFPATLGSYTTTLMGSQPARTANIQLAADSLDGRILEPGEVLSFDAAVGPRSYARGFQMAPVILHETRQMQAGGGVCQVASTLFVAGLLSGLSPVERWRHSTPVDYIPLGFDATIAWGAKDLKLRNDTGQRVRVRVFVTGATLSARFEAEEGSPEHFDLATEERELPADPGIEDAGPGREIELYRLRESPSGASREFLHRDVFPPTRGRSGR